jgi:hypothetical protein
MINTPDAAQSSPMLKSEEPDIGGGVYRLLL